jgi:xanthine phosphoribosyltransferase
MQELVERIRREGQNLGGGILKIDTILNHQIDPGLMWRMGQSMAQAFAGVRVDRILTAEISGIAPALCTAMVLGVPVVYARKKKPITMAGPVYLETAPSHTKGEDTLLLVSSEFLHADEQILVIDDFLASGKTLLALARMVKSANAYLAGVGVVVEKTFEGGRDALVAAGYDVPVHALATITAMEGRSITLADDE